MSAPAVPLDPRRDLSFEGGCNLRDLGGYRTADGRSVRWHQVYRSGELRAATPADIALLLERGIRLVCDLRSGPERNAAPNPWIAATAIESWGRPIAQEVGDSRQLLSNCLTSAAATHAVMTESYRAIPFDQADAYAHLFQRLYAGDTPILFHCSAGKDRSGVAAALLLAALGVPPETIMADYLLSNRVSARIRAAFLADPRHAAALGDLREPWSPLMLADPAYLDAMFASIERQRGHVAAYFHQDLGIDAAGMRAIQERLLE